MNNWRLLLIGLIVLLPLQSVVHGSAASDATRSHAELQVSATPTPVWARVVVAHGDFSLSLPPGWSHIPLMGIDSFVGQLVGDGVTLFYDSGWYSNQLVEPGTPGYEVTFENIDGRSAKLVIAKSPAGCDDWCLLCRHRSTISVAISCPDQRSKPHPIPTGPCHSDFPVHSLSGTEPHEHSNRHLSHATNTTCCPNANS